jgi:hypothetical protein
MDKISKKGSKTSEFQKKKAKKVKEIPVTVNVFPDDSVQQKPKRKRETATEDHSKPSLQELEIDISAPTPPSKKALRQQKKSKISPTESLLSAKTAPTHEPAGDTTHPDRQSLLKKGPPRADYSVWIGNLSYTTEVKSLRGWLVRGDSRVTDKQITRINLPLNADGQSKGYVPPQLGESADADGRFAYVDFVSEESMRKVIDRSEESLDGRKLLIKNAKSFDGRPSVGKERFQVQKRGPWTPPRQVRQKKSDDEGVSSADEDMEKKEVTVKEDVVEKKRKKEYMEGEEGEEKKRRRRMKEENDEAKKKRKKKSKASQKDARLEI